MGKYVSITTPVTSVNGIAINCSKPASNTNYSNSNGRTVNYIVCHYTGNSSDSAWGNANYFQSAYRDVSAHYFVDEEEIYQSVDICDTAWHCGSTYYYHNECRNANSIGIEMCCSGGYKVSTTTKENTAQLVAALCKYLGITDVDKYVVRHYDVSHKKCPAQMAGEGNAEWKEFKARIKAIMKPAPAAMSFNVGDIVNFIGKTHYKSANAAIGSAASAGEAKVSAISAKGKHPYHLIRVVGGKSTVYGWVNVEDIEAVKKLAVIIKMASMMNITNSKVIKDVACDVLGDTVILKTEVERDATLEISQAMSIAGDFKKVYGKNLQIL